MIEKVEAQTVDLVVTSPPYWGLRSYGQDHCEAVVEAWRASGASPSWIPPYDWYRGAGGILGLEPYPDWFIAHLVQFFDKARRVLRQSGSLWVNLGDTYFARWSSIRENGRQGLSSERQRRRTPSGGYLHDKQLLLIPARFAIAMQDSGWILRNDLIWAKPNPIPRPEVDRLRSTHEHWFHFVQRQVNSRPNYYYDLTAAEAGGADVVMCPTARGSNGHSATFPPEVVGPRIRSSCPEGGLVLDPFCGTGTALVEAVRAGRRALGFELSPDFAAGARQSVNRARKAATHRAPA